MIAFFLNKLNQTLQKIGNKKRVTMNQHERINNLTLKDETEMQITHKIFDTPAR